MSDAALRQTPNSTLYRAIWRWHFYAGLIVLPFMILLAITGGLYLFNDEINDTIYGDLRRVDPSAAAYLPPSELVTRALMAHPGTMKAYQSPSEPGRTAEIKIIGSDGMSNAVYVNPYSGLVLGSMWDAGPGGSPLMWTIRKLHSLEYIGWWGNRIIECVAGWAILLVASGIYLWWPRGRKVGVLRPKSNKGRPMWRDLHAVTGIYTSVFIVFLAFTGLPWSGVWGKYFSELSYTIGLGIPDGYWANFPTSTVLTGEALEKTPWILENRPMPVSGTANGDVIGLDNVIQTVENMGIHAGYTLTIPDTPEGVFTASVYPDDVLRGRVIHLDQYTGDVLVDLEFSDLGALGRASEWGTSIHMGQAFGLVNQLILLLACIAIILMAVSALIMWWKRRPPGSLGAPTVPSDWRIPKAIFAIIIVAGIIFPLVGLTIFAVILIELALWATARRKTG